MAEQLRSASLNAGASLPRCAISTPGRPSASGTDERS
jgi:hypothetical protein